MDFPAPGAPHQYHHRRSPTIFDHNVSLEGIVVPLRIASDGPGDKTLKR